VSETLIKRLRSKYPDNAAWDDAADEIERITARVQQLEAGISAIFNKRKGAYGTALIDRGELELCVDLENLRKLLPASNACEGT
jgi:hypothetical protein